MIIEEILNPTEVTAPHRAFLRFELLFLLIGLALVAGVVFYFAPDNIKERGLSYINESSLIPEEIKKTAEDIYATPAYKREKLLKELEANLGSLQEFVEETSQNPEPAKKLIERTKEIVTEVLAQNNDPTIIKQVTETVTAKLINSNNSCEQK